MNGVLASAPEGEADASVVAFFGEPRPQGAWSWRFEGPNVSLNFGVTANAWTSTPFFLGIDPARAAEGEREGVDPLGAHAQLARELLASCDDAQRARAIRGDAPEQLFFGPDRERLPVFRPGGLRAGLMNESQREMLRRLIALTTDDVRSGRAGESSHAAFDGDAFDGVHFVWMGAPDGERFYYRLQSDTALIEFGALAAGRVRMLWRDRERDFGRGDSR